MSGVRVLVLLAVVALVATACGSSSGSSPSAASSTHTQTTGGSNALDAVAARELARLESPTKAVGAQLSPPSASTLVDRRYLTQLFDDAQRVWRQDFATAHLAYRPARLVFFFSKTQSACGRHTDSGPFYCPADRSIYMDLKFFAVLRREHGLGKAADAFILGHEFGHHVQQLLGIARAVAAANDSDPDGSNARSVKVELQADCLAGVWASSAYRRSQRSADDLSHGLKTAEVIGDDYLAEAAGQVVDSAMWTHGSSKQRQDWLSTGFKSGRPDACNTFTIK